MVQPLDFLYPSSFFITTMSLVGFLSISFFGVLEILGIHLQYSKLWNANSRRIKVSSTAGMLLLYAPACLFGFASFWIFPENGFRSLLVASALTIHFFKRVLEILFVHKYSGGMVLDSGILISLSYTLSTATMIYIQHLVQGSMEPSIDLKYPGILLFLVGIYGNFYHHLLLSRLRRKDEKGYKIPRGGLFHLVICPHYLFEIIGFIGVSFISQTLYASSFTLGTTVYLIGRSYATRKWYLSKFENFPREVKALVPYIF
ncbi:Steroid 5-alpha-reductase DET2 [Vitis vinifera]|uniref:Steroid 5-alpha-reductase DET2 n=1 Tax=Vitis vinifera TaxID=29760 RepID=A0A438FJN7_VITVI|nr:Steroid 5-alpha-reductase DET2 [Vitis vinifera]